MKINQCNAQEKLLKSKRTEKEIQKRVLTTARKTKEKIAKQLNPMFRGKLRQDSRKGANGLTAIPSQFKQLVKLLLHKSRVISSWP